MIKAKGYISFWSPPPTIRQKFIQQAATELLIGDSVDLVFTEYVTNDISLPISDEGDCE